MKRTCCGCEQEFTPGSNERNPRLWCSEACRLRNQCASRASSLREKTAARSRVYLRDCSVCSERFVARAYGTVVCSPTCRKKSNAQKAHLRYLEHDELAAEANRQRAAAYRAQRSPEQHAEDLRRGSERVKAAGYTESKRSADARRRARTVGAPAVEKFTRAEIFDRDAWRCGICQRKVDHRVAYPHPLSPSLDHVVPLSQGGEHTKVNSRLAHLRCNVARGNRGGPEQLSLVG